MWKEKLLLRTFTNESWDARPGQILPNFLSLYTPFLNRLFPSFLWNHWQILSSYPQDAIAVNQQGITFSSLKSQLSKHDGLLENLTIRSATIILFFVLWVFPFMFISTFSASTGGWFHQSRKKLSKRVRSRHRHHSHHFCTANFFCLSYKINFLSR